MKYFKPFGVQQEYEMNMHGVWEGVKVFKAYLDISISISSIVRVNYLDGIFLSVFIAQVAEMRALKKEVHRQMQIHGDYKVGGTLSSNGHGG